MGFSRVRECHATNQTFRNSDIKKNPFEFIPIRTSPTVGGTSPSKLPINTLSRAAEGSLSRDCSSAHTARQNANVDNSAVESSNAAAGHEMFLVSKRAEGLMSAPLSNHFLFEKSSDFKHSRFTFPNLLQTLEQYRSAL